MLQDLLNKLSGEIPQNTAAWDRIRLGRFTASKIWQLMGEPRSKAAKEAGLFSETGERYIAQTIAEELTGCPVEETWGRALDWGNEHEEEAILALADKMGVEKPEYIQFKPPFTLFNEYAGGSPDAKFYLSDGNGGYRWVGVEVKCPFNSINHFWHSQIIDAETLKEIDSTYYWQVCLNILCQRAAEWVFCSYDPRYPEAKRVTWSFIYPSVDDLTTLCEKIDKAWTRRADVMAKFMATDSANQLFRTNE
jgi:hypothetical protein